MIERPPIIDHDREEPPRDTSKSPWGLLAAIIVLLWFWYIYFHSIDWIAVGIGALTAGAFVAWATEYTGNKVPASWRRKPPGTRRP